MEQELLPLHSLKGQLLEFRPSPVLLHVSAAVSLTTLVELPEGTAVSVVLMAFHGAGWASLPDEMQLDQHGSPQAESKYQTSHYHPLVCAASIARTPVLPCLSLPTFL